MDELTQLTWKYQVLSTKKAKIDFRRKIGYLAEKETFSTLSLLWYHFEGKKIKLAALWAPCGIGRLKPTSIPAHECFSNWKWYLSASRWSEPVKGGGTIDLSRLMDLVHSWDMGPHTEANKSSVAM